jgi:tetratricopeptide (TPR) repeat protein
MLYYEKFSISKENSVFKFKLLLENNQIKFSLDDLQSGRVYAPVIDEKLSDAAINKLKMAIEDTNFMTSRQQESIDMEEENNRNFTRLIIGYDDKFNDLTVKDIPLASFSKVEQAITDFLQEEVGLDPSMSESKEVLLREAKERFDRAENQFNSYKNQPGNLWRSIENYKIAMKRYEVFADKPQEWKIARERYNKAQAILEKIRKDGNIKVNLLCQQREYRRALEECTRLMDFFPETSTTYKKIRNTKLQIEKIISGDKK